MFGGKCDGAVWMSSSDSTVELGSLPCPLEEGH